MDRRRVGGQQQYSFFMSKRPHRMTALSVYPQRLGARAGGQVIWDHAGRNGWSTRRSAPREMGEPKKPVSAPPQTGSHWVYPRVGGGTWWSPTTGPVSRGHDGLQVYPRVGGGTNGPCPRFTRPGHRQAPALGSIPAWAGEPIRERSVDDGIPVTVWPRGLSPRGRGNRSQAGATSGLSGRRSSPQRELAKRLDGLPLDHPTGGPVGGGWVVSPRLGGGTTSVPV